LGQNVIGLKNRRRVASHGTKFTGKTEQEHSHKEDADPAPSKGKNADWYTVSLGANWTPNKWLTVKPEVRYDWTKNSVDSFNYKKGYPGDTKRDQLSGGMSAVVQF